MKDKDAKLIWEARISRIDPDKMGVSDSDGVSHGDEPDLRDTWKSTETAEKIKNVHGWDVEKDRDGKWWRLDAPGGERPVTGDEHWDIMRIEDPEKEAEYKRKLGEGEGTDQISGQRWSDEGHDFDANADLNQEVSDIGDLLEAFYAGDYSPEDHDTVAKALFTAKKTLEGFVGINTDFDVHGKPEGNWQDRAAKAGKKFSDEGGKLFSGEDPKRSWQDSGARPPGV